MRPRVLHERKSPDQGAFTLKVACAVFLVIVAFFLSRSAQDIMMSDVDTDISRYYSWYERAKWWDIKSYLGVLRYEPLYSLLTWIFSNLGFEFTTFVYVEKAFLTIVFLYFSMHITGSVLWGAIGVLLFILSPIFYSYTENVVRQGFAFALFLMATTSLLRGRSKVFFALSLCASMFHSSALIWCACSYISSLGFVYNRGKYLFALLAVVTIAYALNIPISYQSYIQSIGDILGVGYFDRYGDVRDSIYTVGFKIKFLLASVALFAGLAVWRWLRRPDVIMKRMFALSVLLTVGYMLCSGFAFYDRLASVGWSFVPVVWATCAAILFSPGRTVLRPEAARRPPPGYFRERPARLERPHAKYPPTTSWR